MKNRDYKQFEKGGIYHIYNRGVGKMDIFKDEEDLKVFLHRLQENLFPQKQKKEVSEFYKKVYLRKLLPPDSFDLICYCLMPNHFHLLIQQKTELPVSKLLLKICTGYSIYFNKKNNRVGSLFQDAFKAVPIENNEQLLWVSLYIHENPKKSALVKSLEDYKWSSFLDYKEGKEQKLCNKKIILEQFHSEESYLKYFLDPEQNREAQNQMVGFQDLFLDDDFLATE